MGFKNKYLAVMDPFGTLFSFSLQHSINLTCRSSGLFRGRAHKTQNPSMKAKCVSLLEHLEETMISFAGQQHDFPFDPPG